ncbi:glycosyltransferase family 2 protein [Rhodopirellula sp. JC639]|uniref:glycosyltransferase family 2 protein n=1 Tax=Stieleria mannarensis TaxID=2755585 RepID=UPI0016007E2E|nr:glycosyltransferase family 2 protein [Rhodopirellula sp. JC639]
MTTELKPVERIESVDGADPVRPLASATRLVVILPALNESATIANVIERIPRSIPGIASVDIIVVDDGSTDETAHLARQGGADVVRHPTNLGVGAAFASGVEAALSRGADVIVNMDADGQFRPEDIPELVAPIVREGFGFVTCTRFADRAKLPEMPAIKLWGNRMMCRLINAITGGPKFSDVSCGFRAYSRNTALKLNLFGRFTYTQESFIDLAAKGIAMTEVPLVVRGEREHGKSRVASNLWRYGFRSLTIILRALRDWRPLLFFGSIALLFVFAGLVLVGFVGFVWLLTGRTSPWTSLITIGGVSLVMGVSFAVLSLVADQIGRSRRIQEELLYLQRRSKPASNPVAESVQ